MASTKVAPNNDLTIFVNTSDGFEDCWDPFFKLFTKFWPDCPFPIVLGTETKDYAYPGLNIRCSKVSEGEGKRLGWSECLMRALDAIETPYILYLQEDYFLEEPVKEKVILALLEDLRKGYADAIQLFGADGAKPFQKTESPLILEVNRRAKMRFSMQATLWRKSFLRSQIRKHETQWQLESYGSLRTRWAKEKLCCLNPVDFPSKGRSDVFPYGLTGVIAGRWLGEVVVPLFAKHKIEMDFSKRGFYAPRKRWAKRKSFFRRVIDRVRSLV